MVHARDDEVLARLGARVPAISDAIEVSIAKLPGGLSNRNYLVTADEERFVVRIGCDNYEALGIDRRAEEAAARRAHAEGFAPEIVLFTQPEGHSVVRFVSDARSPTQEEFASLAMVRRVASRLSDVHALPDIDGRFDPFATIRRWSETLDRRGTSLPSRLAGLLERVAHAEGVRPPLTRPELVVCHNDPYYLNFLDDGTLWLIDWEYAGMGDPMYDLAAVGHTLDANGREVLLETYYGAATPELRRNLDALLPVVVCWNAMWSLIQIEEGIPGFDYLQMANDYLDMISEM